MHTYLHRADARDDATRRHIILSVQPVRARVCARVRTRARASVRACTRASMGVPVACKLRELEEGRAWV